MTATTCKANTLRRQELNQPNHQQRFSSHASRRARHITLKPNISIKRGKQPNRILTTNKQPQRELNRHNSNNSDDLHNPNNNPDNNPDNNPNNNPDNYPNTTTTRTTIRITTTRITTTRITTTLTKTILTTTLTTTTRNRYMYASSKNKSSVKKQRLTTSMTDFLCWIDSSHVSA